MKTQTKGFAFVIAAMVGGCAVPFSEVPLVTNFPTSKQEKVQAAAHWNAIASDVAKQISLRFPDKRPLYIVPTSKSPFEHAFLNLLTSSLVGNGFPVMKQPGAALSVETETQVVAFSPNRAQYRHLAGSIEALMAGAWALHVGEATPGAVAFAATATADAYYWHDSEFASGETPQTEIIITTRITDGSQYLAHLTSIYYVADTDKALYDALPVSNIRVTGGE